MCDIFHGHHSVTVLANTIIDILSHDIDVFDAYASVRAVWPSELGTDLQRWTVKQGTVQRG
jgi:hypothetical protein